MSGSPRGTMMVATSKGARRSIPARMASAPPSRCSGPVVSSNVRGPSASEQRRAIARRHSALPDSAAALKCAGSAGSRRGIVGRVVAAEANGDHRLVRRARRQPGIALGGAGGAGAGRDDRVARRGSRARPANATPIRHPAEAGRAARPPAGASDGPEAAGRQHEQPDRGGGRRQRGRGRLTPSDGDLGGDELVVGERAHGGGEQRGRLGAAFGRRGQHQELRVAQLRAPLEQRQLVGAGADGGGHRSQPAREARDPRDADPGPRG